MYTQLIAKRFARHHNQLHAYLDGLDQACRALDSPQDPVASFLSQRSFLFDFLNFMDLSEEQHEREEERVLMPVLRARMESCPDSLELETLEQISREHRRGQELLQKVKEEFERLQRDLPSSSRDCRRLADLMQETASHFRDHIRTEDTVILPTAIDLIPDRQDDLWVQSEGRSGSQR